MAKKDGCIESSKKDYRSYEVNFFLNLDTFYKGEEKKREN